MTTADYAIDLTGVAKTYRGKIHALRGVDMRVHRGEVFGLLGPNGAGKSTLVKILMTVIRASRCQGSVLGQPVGDKHTLARVGYLPEHHRFPPYLTGAQVLDFYGALGKVGRDTRARRTAELLELVGMTEWAKTKVGRYSKGMRQRIGIAQALMNDPDLVLLDEPTDGVDPVGRRDIRGIVARLREQRKSVLINSHLLSELEMVCDRVSILVQGQVNRQGTIDELTEGQHWYEIEIVPDPALGAEGTLRAALGEHADGLALDHGKVRIPGDAPEAVQPVIDRLRAARVVIRSVRPHRPSLEDLFMDAVTTEDGGTLAPGAAGGAR